MPKCFVGANMFVSADPKNCPISFVVMDPATQMPLDKLVYPYVQVDADGSFWVLNAPVETTLSVYLQLDSVDYSVRTPDFQATIRSCASNYTWIPNM